MEGISREGIHPNSGGTTGSEETTPTYTGGTGLKRRAAGIPAMLADGLQAGADAIRQRRASTSTGSAVTAIANDPAIAAVTDSVATGMQSSAEWLRDADMDKLKEGVEKQVKEHPARSLFVALGAGFLLAKVLRR